DRRARRDPAGAARRRRDRFARSGRQARQRSRACTRNWRIVRYRRRFADCPAPDARSSDAAHRVCYHLTMRAVAIVCLAALVGRAAAADPSDFLTAYDKDPKAKAVATDLFDNLGHVTTVGADEIMDGGYRGKIHLVPELPVGKYRQQLQWAAAALVAIDTFFSDVKAPKYRWRN